jgi:hypothetical protein
MIFKKLSLLTVRVGALSLILGWLVLPSPLALATEDPTDPNDPAILWNCYETLPVADACESFTRIYNEVRRYPTLMNDIRRISPLGPYQEASCRSHKLSASGNRKYLEGLVSLMGLGASSYGKEGLIRYSRQLHLALEAEHTATELGMINQARCITDARVGSAPIGIRQSTRMLRAGRLVSRGSGVLLAAEILLTATNKSLGSSLDQAYAFDPVRLLQLPTAAETCNKWIRHYPHIRRAVLALENIYNQAVWERNENELQSCQADGGTATFRDTKELRSVEARALISVEPAANSANPNAPGASP